MNFKLASIRLADNETLYFYNSTVQEEYINKNGGPAAYKSIGPQIVPFGEEIIDTDEWRSNFLGFAKNLGMDTSTLKDYEINGTADPNAPEETQEERDERFKKDMDPKNRYAVFEITDDGDLKETGDDIEDFIKAKKERGKELTMDALIKKCKEFGIDHEKLIEGVEDDKVFDTLADAIWEESQRRKELEDKSESENNPAE